MGEEPGTKWCETGLALTNEAGRLGSSVFPLVGAEREMTCPPVLSH
jgi:hypothetical protein